MQKKILSLILSGVLLSQISCFCTFTTSTYGDLFDIFKIGEKPGWVDVCKDQETNQYNQPVDVQCCFKQLMNDQRATDGISTGVMARIGPNGDNEIKMWHSDQISGFVKEFLNLISDRNKDVEKEKYMMSLSGTVKNQFMLSSKDEADRITTSLLVNSPYFKFNDVEASRNEIETLKNKVFPRGPITENDVELWKIEHADLVEKYEDEICNWFETLFGLCKKKVNKKIKRDSMDEMLKAKIRADVGASSIDQALYLMSRGKHVDKDTLVVRSDFSKDNYHAQVYFTNLGLSKKIEIDGDDIKSIFGTYDVDNVKCIDKEEL